MLDELEKTKKYEQPYLHHCCKDVNPEIHSMMYVLVPLGYDIVLYRSNVDHISSGKKTFFSLISETNVAKLVLVRVE
jgi:hypothetical protein